MQSMAPLIDGGEALTGGLFLEGGAGVCEHCYSWARRAEMLALDATQLRPSIVLCGKQIREQQQHLHHPQIGSEG